MSAEARGDGRREERNRRLGTRWDVDHVKIRLSLSEHSNSRLKSPPPSFFSVKYKKKGRPRGIAGGPMQIMRPEHCRFPLRIT
jgi:hypothetical protein